MICIVLLIILNLINMIFFLYSGPNNLSGSAITTGTISFFIEGEEMAINISSPLNTTYNFGIGDPYTIHLNVSASFDVDNWWFTLLDLTHDEVANESVGFSPNITFEAVRWANKMCVYAESAGRIINENVTFFVNVPNSAPFFGPVNSSIYVCEDNDLDYWFNVTDVDEQVLSLALTPSNPFYLNPTSTSASEETTQINLYSGVLGKNYAVEGSNGWKVYKEKIEVTDQTYSDFVYTNITVIEINNKPVISNIGVQTIQTKGDNSTFYKELQVTDEEEGNQSSENLLFSISFSGEELFNITEDGVMNFTPTSSQVGVHNITVCVNDTGIDNPHENISLCGQDGSSITTCQNFSLTVTNQNREPTILDYYPGNLSLDSSGAESLYFNITKYDPDWTIPDAYWYVDNVLEEYDNNNSLVDEFNYRFGCGVSGSHTIKAEITDGLLNDSLTWTIDVSLLVCPVSPEKSGGGGGGGGIRCVEKWGCSIWGVCQNAEKSLEAGLLSGEDYRIIKEECVKSGLNEEFCGVQIRECIDINNCNTTYTKPSEFQSCHYTEKPSCKDGIKNCHDGACELLIDCGGPCPPCPTCSDGIKNQGEEGIDCGGPCPWKCPEEIPLLKRTSVLYSFLIIILLLILIIIIKFRKVILYRKELKGKANVRNI
jgi:hypothetical protein